MRRYDFDPADALSILHAAVTALCDEGLVSSIEAHSWGYSPVPGCVALPLGQLSEASSWNGSAVCAIAKYPHRRGWLYVHVYTSVLSIDSADGWNTRVQLLSADEHTELAFILCDNFDAFLVEARRQLA